MSESYFPIPPASVIPGTVGKFSIYLKCDDKFVLYANKGQTVSPKIFDDLAERGMKSVYVMTTEIVDYDDYVKTNLGSILGNCLS